MKDNISKSDCKQVAGGKRKKASSAPTELSEIIALCEELAGDYPEILQAIRKDQIADALRKKTLRQEEKSFNSRLADRAAGIQYLPMELPSSVPVVQRLCTGRPRMDPLTVLLFLSLRGRYGSASDTLATEIFRESSSIAAFLERHGLEVPGASTLLDNLNCLSDDTRKLILKSQLRLARSEKLDDMSRLELDSTPSEACMSFPSDTRLMSASILSAFRILENLQAAGMSAFSPDARQGVRLERAGRLSAEIAMVSGKDAERKRRKLSGKLFDIVLALCEDADVPLRAIEGRIASNDYGSYTYAQWRDFRDLAADCRFHLQAAAHSAWQLSERVFSGRKVKNAEKFFGAHDTDADMIVKGGRTAVLGYHPRIARSYGGLVAGFILEKGNTPDSSSYLPMLKEVIENTGSVPSLFTTDDGYTSRENREGAEKLQIEDIVFSGAKGKRLTPEDEWNSPAAADARRHRSAAESIMSVLKGSYAFGQMRRCGLSAVRGEMMEKIIAYNFERILLLRKRRRDQSAA